MEKVYPGQTDCSGRRVVRRGNGVDKEVAGAG